MLGAVSMALSVLFPVSAVASEPTPSVEQAAAEGGELPDIALPDTVWPTLDWVEETDNFLQVRYRDADKRFTDDWGRLPQNQIASGRTLRIGATGPRVASLRRRLGLGSGAVFDQELASRIAKYRAAHGLAAGSAADPVLIASLNAGFAHYARVIESNRRRAAGLPSDLGNRFVLVDSAEQRLYMYEGERIAGSMRVIVGKAADQTPVLSSKIDHAVLNPYWNVPPDLTQSKYADRVIRGGEAYLRRTGFEPLSDWGDEPRVLRHHEVDWRAVADGETQLRLRQKPGPGNGMGKIKIMFPNSFGVYLHDTPSTGLFKKSERMLSAGCVRLEKPWMLAEWLFGSRPQAVGFRPEQRVDLAQEVPVYLAYFTAVPTASGFEFRPDGYAKDAI